MRKVIIMNQEMGLFITLALGLFILLGSVIVFVTKNSNKVVNFSISMAFGVMICLGLFELLPEALEHMQEGSKAWQPLLIGFTVVGVLLLGILDKFVPDHDLMDQSEKEINENLHHIGIVASIALILHNIIEGMAIFSTVSTNMNMGLMMCIGVGLHNIPLGMVITSTIYKYNKSIKKTIGASILISISTFLGGVIMYFISNMITPLTLGILLSITLGMILYIVLLELLPHVLEHKKESTTLVGVGVGILVLFISKLF